MPGGPAGWQRFQRGDRKLYRSTTTSYGSRPLFWKISGMRTAQRSGKSWDKWKYQIVKCSGEISSNSKMFWPKNTPWLNCRVNKKLETHQKNGTICYDTWSSLREFGPFLPHPHNISRSNLCNHFLRPGAWRNCGLEITSRSPKTEHPTCGAAGVLGMPRRRGWGHMQVGCPRFLRCKWWWWTCLGGMMSLGRMGWKTIRKGHLIGDAFPWIKGELFDELSDTFSFFPERLQKFH